MRLDRRALLLGALATAGCAQTRLVDGEPLPPIEGGIGGTGVVGVVTALGSIRVAGLRIGLEGAQVEDAFGRRSASSIGPGHSVTVQARGADDDLSATRVVLTPPLVGRVQSIDRAAGHVRVLSVDVTLEPGVEAAVEVGDRVAVCGAWWGDGVVASRLDRLEPDGLSAVSGALRMAGGRPAVNGVPLLSDRASPPAAGGFLTVTGEEHEAGLRPHRMTSGRFAAEGGTIGRLRVEGYLEPAADDPGFVVSGLGHRFDPGARLARLAGGRALFLGRFNGLFAVDHGLRLPDTLAARARLLDQGRADLIPTR